MIEILSSSWKYQCFSSFGASWHGMNFFVFILIVNEVRNELAKIYESNYPGTIALHFYFSFSFVTSDLQKICKNKIKKLKHSLFKIHFSFLMQKRWDACGLSMVCSIIKKRVKIYNLFFTHIDAPYFEEQLQGCLLSSLTW